MAYQVIARKWRPQKFEEVTGQEAITRTLRNAIEHDRLHHAYLFAGARGVGKTTTARLLAKALNCHKSESPTAVPCAADDPEACASCREIAEGRSIDVLEIDAASNTGVDNVREAIINTVAVRPARDRFKVFIIDEVHMLSGAAFNALLKTLEEPPSRVVFVMATTESHKIPDTILSRSQQFEFRTIAAPKIVERLRLIADAERIEVSEDALREIARAGEGSMRDAQSAFDQVISFSTGAIGVEDVETALGLAGAEMRARVVRAVADSRPADALAVVDDLVMRGHDLRNFCRDLMAHVRDLLLVKVGGAAGDTGDAERRQLASEAESFAESDLVRFFHSLTETERLLRESAHPRYQLEIGLVKLVELRRLAPLSQILERLHALEEALRTGKAPAGGPATPAPASGGGSGPPPRRGSAGGGLASSADTSRHAAARDQHGARETDSATNTHAAHATNTAADAKAGTFVGGAEGSGADAFGAGLSTFVDDAPPFVDEAPPFDNADAPFDGDAARAADAAMPPSAAAGAMFDAETPPFEPPPPRATPATPPPPSAASSRVKSIPTLPPRSAAANGGPSIPSLPSKNRAPAPPAVQTSQATPDAQATAATDAPPAPPAGLRLVPSSPPATSTPAPSSSFTSSFASAASPSTPPSTPQPAPSAFTPPPGPPSFFDEPPPPPFVEPPASFDDGPSLPAEGAAHGGASDSSLLARVKSLLDARRKPFLVIALEGARKVCFDEEELYVEFAPEGRHLRDTLAKPDNVKTLREVCAEAAGRGVGVRIAVREAGDGDEEEGAPASKRDEARAEREQLRELAEQHPAVQKMLRTFRAEIIEVRRVEEVPPPPAPAAQPKRP